MKHTQSDKIWKECLVEAKKKIGKVEETLGTKMLTYDLVEMLTLAKKLMKERTGIKARTFNELSF